MKSVLKACAERMPVFGRLLRERSGLIADNARLEAQLTIDRNMAPSSRMRFPTFGVDTNQSISGDYFRYASIGLAIQRMLSENILGSLAEVGVYRGNTSRFIHALAPDRVYYLFDTFEGFPRQDYSPDMPEDTRFRGTSVEAVLRNIGGTNNVVIRQGYVPDTLRGLEDERFAFVLLDLDLYNPTISSLNFFYPRLVRGGYSMVHDYNNPESNWACNRAVNSFMVDKVEKIIEIADEWGTVFFRKL